MQELLKGPRLEFEAHFVSSLIGSTVVLITLDRTLKFRTSMCSIVCFKSLGSWS